jgi:hypothetical protein
MVIEDNMELNIPSEVLGLDCFNPSSYLVEDVTVSQEQCIDLSAYGKLAVQNVMLNHANNHFTAMNLIAQTQTGKPIVEHRKTSDLNFCKSKHH